MWLASKRTSAQRCGEVVWLETSQLGGGWGGSQAQVFWGKSNQKVAPVLSCCFWCCYWRGDWVASTISAYDRLDWEAVSRVWGKSPEPTVERNRSIWVLKKVSGRAGSRTRDTPTVKGEYVAAKWRSPNIQCRVRFRRTLLTYHTYTWTNSYVWFLLRFLSAIVSVHPLPSTALLTTHDQFPHVDSTSNISSVYCWLFPHGAVGSRSAC